MKITMIVSFKVQLNSINHEAEIWKSWILVKPGLRTGLKVNSVLVKTKTIYVYQKKKFKSKSSVLREKNRKISYC